MKNSMHTQSLELQGANTTFVGSSVCALEEMTLMCECAYSFTVPSMPFWASSMFSYWQSRGHTQWRMNVQH